LIAARLYNQSQTNRDSQLFETANVYLPRTTGLPGQQFNLGVIGLSDIRTVAGMFEEILHRVCGPAFIQTTLTKSLVSWNTLAPQSGIVWQVGGETIAWIGQLNRSIVDSMKLDCSAAVGEMNLDMLLEHARLVPQLQPIVPFPTVERDLNLILDEATQWQSISAAIQKAAGPLCIQVLFREIYRDTKKDGDGKKRVLLSMHLRSDTETLTGEQADSVMQNALSACKAEFQATILQ